ncbi:MAG: UDP-N-acetylmuramoyl-L-alanyl-D-glutamate--2,6-diaminopimelate ligase, partial [Erysipelotrichaceae bacterium]|nr:UDP-N-acetylmuramoyl-L-alanyl-D-glutamate--2,6-diaminopimelate ligase [Erysipelotrichaceae bacterium]
EKCDLLILTVSDSRMENPADIAERIRQGVSNANVIYIDDRYMAIRQALELANPKDTVLILGKGDETYLDIRGEKTYWPSDAEVAREIVRELYGRNENEAE